MASYKRRQPSDYNQSVPETEFIPETHAYQEKHFQPTLNQPVSETHSETEYGSTVTPDSVESSADRNPRSTVTERSDQPGEFDLTNGQVEQNVQGNSDSGTQYSTPDVSSGVSSDPGGFATYGGGAAATAAGSATAATSAVATSAVATISSVAITTVGAAVIAATLILPLVIGVPSAIIFDEISVTDTTVYYSIYFEDYEEDMELTVSLHNNFTDRTHKVESESISILEENLKPGMDYKITVYGGMSTVLEEKTVRTNKVPSAPELDVKSFDYSPQEGRVTIDSELTGDTSGLSGFKAVVYTDVDNVRTALCSSDLTTLDGEQSVPLTITTDKKYSATFVIEATDADGATIELYSNDFTVFGTPYYSAPSFTLANDTLTVVCGYYDPYSARSDYQLVTKVINSQSTEPVISYTALNSGITTIENISGGHAVFEMMAYVQYTEGGSTVYPVESTYDYVSLDSLVTVGTGSAVDVQGGVEGHLTVTVGDCSETLTAVVSVYSQDSGTSIDKTVTLMNNTTSTYTFDLLSSYNTNTELQFYVEVSDVNPMRGAYNNVIFAYASYTGGLITTNINPLEDEQNRCGMGITFNVDDPYGIWSDYRATVTQVGASVTTICSDVPIENNRVYFTNTSFQNGDASLTVTCTQGGSPVTVIDGVTIHVYSGPVLSVPDYLFPETNLYSQSIDLYSEFEDFGTEAEPKTLYAYLIYNDLSASSYAITTCTDEGNNTVRVTAYFDLDASGIPHDNGEIYSLRIEDENGNLLVYKEDCTMISV